MAKKVAEQPTQTAETSMYDTLRGAGLTQLWEARPKGKPFHLECYLTPNRRLVLLQVNDNGSILTFEEVTTASFEEGIKQILAQ